MPHDPDHATSFGRAADAYERGRPEYPRDAASWLVGPAPRRVLDLGAGTGKLSRAIVELGHDVVAVDPDRAMLRVLAGALPRVATHEGHAERIPLEAASVDVVVMGQAWHWVEPVAASREIGRVLRPGGTLGLVWNIRDERVPWVARMTAIMHSSRAEELIAGDGPRVHAPFGPLEHRKFEWTRPMGVEALLSMVRSRSHFINADAETRARIEQALDGVFGSVPELAAGGIVQLPYVTHAFRATLAG